MDDSSTMQWKRETYERGCALSSLVTHMLICTFVPPLSSWTRQRQCQLLNYTQKFTVSNENMFIAYYLLTYLHIILIFTDTVLSKSVVLKHPSVFCHEIKAL